MESTSILHRFYILQADFFQEEGKRDPIIQQFYQHTKYSFFSAEGFSWMLQLKFCICPQEIQQIPVI